MREKKQFHRGEWRFRCLIKHAWAPWSTWKIKHFLQGHVDGYLYTKRRCKRCNSIEVKYTENIT